MPPAGASPAAASMFLALDAYIESALADLRANLPRNPQYAAQIDAKIALLSQPGLGAAISSGRWYTEGGVTSRDGRAIPIVTIFPQAGMRVEAEAAVRELERVFAVLESYLAVAFGYEGIRLWYGFIIGNSGGGGSLYMEDRTTYEARTSASRLPYDAILAHEHAHSYIGNEAMTQFLELYVFNVLRTGTTNVESWAHTRGWVAGAPGNTDAAALLDVYQLIGADAMAGGYRAVLPLRPPYGLPLSAAVRQAFVETLPEGVRSQVLDKLSAITF
jgi:hypothetical protein